MIELNEKIYVKKCIILYNDWMIVYAGGLNGTQLSRADRVYNMSVYELISEYWLYSRQMPNDIDWLIDWSTDDSLSP